MSAIQNEIIENKHAKGVYISRSSDRISSLTRTTGNNEMSDYNHNPINFDEANDDQNYYPYEKLVSVRNQVMIKEAYCDSDVELMMVYDVIEDNGDRLIIREHRAPRFNNEIIPTQLVRRYMLIDV
jgi:hypothetical protein